MSTTLYGPHLSRRSGNLIVLAAISAVENERRHSLLQQISRSVQSKQIA
jgi:hypothetical protein